MSKDLAKIAELEHATWASRGEMFRLGFALLFIVGIVLYVSSSGREVSFQLVIAAMIGGYMAMNIGANDVANNVGPAVGSRALTLTGAILIAAIFEAAGALIAGGDVVGTIKGGIINADAIGDTQVFIWVMTAALLADALWLNVATAIGAPVSTTHSIVGGVLGGVIAAAFLYLIKRTITYQSDMIAAAKKMVPILIAVMAWAFGTYLVMKGLKQIWKTDFLTASGIGLLLAASVYLLSRWLIGRKAISVENRKRGVNALFTVPLVFAAALLSFAHGANDVANAIGPLAAINEAILHGDIAEKAPIPLWIMLVGAIGISIGLALYGPKLIRTVGTEITELDQMRAFCIALAAALTVIVASHLGLPVSSTHIAVGAVFGVGFLREYLKANYARMVETIEEHHQGEDRKVVEEFMERFKLAPLQEKGVMLEALKQHTTQADLTKKERKDLKKVYRGELVKRSALLKIAAAWVITVPVSGLLAAMLYFTIRGMMLP